MKPELSIVVPCYNEEKNIPLILERFSRAMRPGIEVILVDNGSTDGSAKVFSRLISKYPFARVVTVRKNIGYGHGIITGLKAAKGKFLAWTHADMQTDPKDPILAHAIMKQQPNPEQVFVKGSRKRRPLPDSFFSFGMSLFALLVLHQWMPDINAQPKLFTRGFFRKMKSPPYDFSLDLYVFYLAKKSRMPILAIPVDFSKRIHGKSHWNIGVAGKWKFIKRNASYIWKLRGTNA